MYVQRGSTRQRGACDPRIGLQSQYNLWAETLYIPNGTNLQYRYVKVPVRSSDNTKFGEIESRISQDSVDLQEVYLWALKTHIGLLFRDSRPKFPDVDATSSPVLDGCESGWAIGLSSGPTDHVQKSAKGDCALVRLSGRDRIR